MCTVQVLNMSSLNPLWYHVTLEKFRLLVPNTTKAKSMKVWTVAFYEASSITLYIKETEMGSNHSSVQTINQILKITNLMIDNEWEQNLVCNVILINITVCIVCHKVWQLIGNACHCQIMSNNEMPLDCGGESIQINLSLSAIWSRETKLHFSDHAVVILFRHGRVTLVWIDQSCVWWAESLSSLSSCCWH